MDIFDWVIEWYKFNCNDDWEHGNGIKINTLDNPGWSISIDLEGTNLEDKKFEKINIDNGDNDWIVCWVENKTFNSASDPNKLRQAFEIFKSWVDEKTKRPIR